VPGISSLRRFRLIHNESFRLAALFAVLFLGLSCVLMGLTYWIVEGTQRAELLATIDADIGTIDSGFRGDEGIDEAVEVIQQRLGATGARPSLASDIYVYLADRNGRRAGNLDVMAKDVGVLWLTRQRGGQSSDIQTLRMAKQQDEYRRGTVLGRGTLLASDVYLFVGRDTRSIVATRTRLLHAFGWVTGVTILLAAAGGIIFSVQFLRRVDAIARTCDAIVAGRFNDRIVLRGSGDELDRLAGAINLMLDRIGALMENLQQVSSDIAHDLRTPLTHLRRRLENARDKSGSVDEYAEAVARAIEDTDELLSMFSALLRISQVDAGTRLAGFRQVSLSTLLGDLVAMYLPVAEDQQKSLQVRMPSEIDIIGDKELLTQLFSNLIENALKHTEPGTHIVVSLERSADAVVAAVADSGAGIPESEREKVLRRFYRLNASRSSSSLDRGYGLGLALVDSIAKLHDAALVLADNAPGLRVVISFPAGK
jgi:signal transduction histidine kinase